jgi:glucose-6-phosphate isomerase
MIKVDLTVARKFIDIDSFESAWAKCVQAHDMLLEGSGPGGDYLGWLKLPENYDREELGRIKRTSEKIREDSEVWLWWELAARTWVPGQFWSCCRAKS